MAHTVSVKRGCGLRASGGIYFETGLSPFGSPVEHFLIDPPVPIDLDALGISSVGVHLVEYRGQQVVMDVVGKQHYPNVADFIEEVRAFGVSRRVRQSFPFSELGPKPMLVMIHANAVIQNVEDYYLDTDARWDCPKNHPHHEVEHLRALAMDRTGLETCAGLWWTDLPPMDPTDTAWVHTAREMPSLHYRATRRPATIVPQYQHGIFAVFPVTNLSVIKSDDAEVMRKAVNAVTDSGLSFSIDLE